MLYYLFDLLDQMNIPGAGVFQYQTFRAGMAVIASLIISMLFGGKIIRMLQRLQVGETVRDLGLDGQKEKEGTPTMGGLLIIAAIIIPTLLFAKLDSIYIQLMLVSTLWMGAIGFLDDYIKVFKKDKEGLAGKFKIMGQVGLGLIVGMTMYMHEDIVIRRDVPVQTSIINGEPKIYQELNENSTVTTIPFVKNNEFDYSDILFFMGEDAKSWSWLIFIPMVIVIVTAVSNGANITDGLDGLATGVSSIVVATLGIFAYVSGNIIFSKFLNIMYIPASGELLVFSGAFIGACIGFLWYNSYPAQVFMGDTGSLAIGGIIAALAIVIRKELLIPVLCGIFLMENLSVMLQVGYFKYSKKRYGEGRRIFKMSPLHHHYQKLGMHESKIVTRFWIVGIMLAIASLVTLKLR